MPSLSEESKQKLADCLNTILSQDKIPLETVVVEIKLDLSKLRSLKHPNIELLIEELDESNQNYRFSIPVQTVQYGYCYYDEACECMRCT